MVTTFINICYRMKVPGSVMCNRFSNWIKKKLFRNKMSFVKKGFKTQLPKISIWNFVEYFETSDYKNVNKKLSFLKTNFLTHVKITELSSLMAWILQLKIEKQKHFLHYFTKATKNIELLLKHIIVLGAFKLWISHGFSEMKE